MNEIDRANIIKELEGAGWALLPATVYLIILSPFSSAGQGGGTGSWLLLWVFLAAGYDLSCRRIPNALSGVALATGVLWAFAQGGVWGVFDSISGCLTGFSIMFVLYLFGMMGGGDVKIVAALSAFLTPITSIQFIILTFICGGLLAVTTLIAVKETGQLKLLAGGVRNFRIIGTGLKMPYGLAIAMGVIALIILKGL